MYVQCTMDMSTWSKWVGSSKHIFLKYLTIIYLKFPDILKFFDILKFSLVPPSSHIEIWLYGYKHLQVSLLPARYHPKLNFLEGDLVASIRARRLIIKLAKSVSKWAASDIMAKLPANTPPANIFVSYMNKEKKQLLRHYRFWGKQILCSSVNFDVKISIFIYTKYIVSAIH